MAEAKGNDIKIGGRVRTLASLGIQKFGKMKQRVKEKLKLSERKSSWTAKEVRYFRVEPRGLGFHDFVSIS